MTNRKETVCITENICIRHAINGTRIFNTCKDVQSNRDLIRKTGKSLEKQRKWKLSRIEEIKKIYNGFIESSEIMEMVKYILSSSVLTLSILKQPKEEIELNNQVLGRLKRFMSLVDFISKYHKDKDNFLGKWKHVFNVITIVENVKDFDHHSNICVDLYPRKDEGDIKIQENQCFGSIVFIDSNSKFSFKKREKCIGLGITNKKGCTFSDSHSNSIPINIFGGSLVQVVYPRNYNCVDERGMFVILDENQEENTGIGEIISFGDLINREANSYHLVGICSLDKTEQSNPSLFLFSSSSHTSRIMHSSKPSNDFNICFVSMISLPMSASLVHLLLPSNPPLDFNKKSFL